jgi:hypothetical protein
MRVCVFFVCLSVFVIHIINIVKCFFLFAFPFFFSSLQSRLPAHHRGLVEGHEVDLTRRATFCTAEEYFVVAFTQEFKALRFLVHENTVQMTRLNGTYLCFWEGIVVITMFLNENSIFFDD